MKKISLHVTILYLLCFILPGQAQNIEKRKSHHNIKLGVQLLKIDGEENRVILSGLFELRFLKKGRPETISDGRFDVGINNDFYRFPE